MTENKGIIIKSKGIKKKGNLIDLSTFIELYKGNKQTFKQIQFFKK